VENKINYPKIKKCKKCGLELSIYKLIKEVIDGVEVEKRVYVCRNKNCPVKEIYE